MPSYCFHVTPLAKVHPGTAYFRGHFSVKPKRKVDESCWNMQISARRYKQQLLQTWEELSIVPLVKLVLVTDRCNALHTIYWWKDIDNKIRCEMERYKGYIPVKSTIAPQTDTLFSWFHEVCSSTKVDSRMGYGTVQENLWGFAASHTTMMHPAIHPGALSERWRW